MSRSLLTLAAALIVAAGIGISSLQPTASAQQGGPPICVTGLSAGDHTLTADARDREGQVSFGVSVDEQGVVTSFTEPGGQVIPPVSMLDIFTGPDAYELPEGVSVGVCGGGESMMEESAAHVCVNLEPGTHEATVNVSGQSQPIVIDVGAGGVVRGIQVLGSNYSGAEGLALMEQFGVSLPAGVEVVECAPAADSMVEDEDGDSPEPTLYANTGSGGLADTSGSNGLWYAIAAVAALVVGGLAVGRRAATITAERRVRHDDPRD